jgi:hypothetical protein
MKKFVFVPVLIVAPVVLLSLLSSILSPGFVSEYSDFNIREVVYGIPVDTAKGYLDYKVVQIEQEGIVRKELTFSNTPLDALKDLGYVITNTTRVISTAPIDHLYNGAFIKVKTLETVIAEVKSDIQFNRLVQGDYTLCERLTTETVEQEGVLGIMTSTVKRIYEDGNLIAEEVLSTSVDKEARPEIVVLEGPNDKPNVENQPNSYDCTYWTAYLKTLDLTDEEYQWLKFVMYCESGCNAASDKGYYKGLFQWDPCFWYKQYPDENIYDGRAQIQHTLEKIRAGAQTMWPSCNNSYLSKQ